MNLLSPVKYLCHVLDCKILLALNSDSSLSTIYTHWKNHEKTDKSCEILRRRHCYMKNRRGVGRKYWCVLIPSQELELMTNGVGQSLALGGMMNGRLVVRADQEFAGKHHLVDNDILKKIVNGESDALEGVQHNVDVAACEAVPRGTIESFFQKKTVTQQNEHERDDNVEEVDGEEVTIVD